MEKPNRSNNALARCARTEDQMKKIVAVAIVLAITMISSGAFAQKTVVPDYYTPSALTSVQEAKADRALMAGANVAIGQLIIDCHGGGRCGPAMVAADKVGDKAKASPGVGSAWVKRQINLAFAKVASKADLEALRAEIEAKLAELDRRITALEARVTVLEVRADAGDRKDAEQDAEIAELKNRMDDAEVGIEANRVAIARAGNEVRIGGALSAFYNSNFWGGVVMGEIDFQIVPDSVRLIIDPGLGISDDGQAVIMLKAGPLFLFGETKSMGIGLEGLFLKEGFNDDGDAFLGGGLRFDAMFHRNFGLTISCAIGADSSMENTNDPNAGYERARQSSLGGMISAGFVVKSGR
jgi:hypothetical protein